MRLLRAKRGKRFEVVQRESYNSCTPKELGILLLIKIKVHLS